MSRERLHFETFAELYEYVSGRTKGEPEELPEYKPKKAKKKAKKEADESVVSETD